MKTEDVVCDYFLSSRSSRESTRYLGVASPRSFLGAVGGMGRPEKHMTGLFISAAPRIGVISSH